MNFFIKREALANVEQLAREGFPYEICGFLGGSVLGQAMELKPAHNISGQPQLEYNIAPEQTLETLLAFEMRGMKLTGVYHSHPRYPARPSQTDIRLADLPGVVYLITSVFENNNGTLDCETRAYRIEKGRAHETKLEVI
ncbi:M67 family metallopeptidase [Candidatus Chlorohelix sp.]|uniref:M67 family metallopeptidase n=1 Tax=Candidatus Chlorohelix sp. TaxID=3139201 RepID=UPI003027C324